MTRISRIVEFEGRTYELSTDAALWATAPFSSYAQLYRIRKDGSRGRRIITDQIVFDVLRSQTDLLEA